MDVQKWSIVSNDCSNYSQKVIKWVWC